MTFIDITNKKKKQLFRRHRKEKDSSICDRIKAVVLKSKGWTNKCIAEALLIHEETVRVHLKDWLASEKLKPESGGSEGKLSKEQTKIVEAHLQKITYTKAEEICSYIESTFQVRFTVSGMTKWLKRHGFSYKHPKATPAKADLKKQEEFIESYLLLLDKKEKDDPVLFIDSAHPTMATKVVCGWIKKGEDKPIKQTASRTRVNVMGAINLSSMKVVSELPEKVNGESTVEFLKKIKKAYPESNNIHIILDQSGYHRSQAVRDGAKENGIILHYLPPYSPNLNPIERLWKIMNEKVRNNIFFPSAKMFRGAIKGFFDEISSKNICHCRDRINDDFQSINPVF